MNEGKEGLPENLNNLPETTPPKEEEDIPSSFKGHENVWREFRERSAYKKVLEEQLSQAKDKFNSLVPLWDRQEKVSQKPDGMNCFKLLYGEFLEMHDQLYEHGGFGDKLKKGSPIETDWDYLNMDKLREIEQQLQDFESSLSILKIKLHELID